MLTISIPRRMTALILRISTILFCLVLLCLVVGSPGNASAVPSGTLLTEVKGITSAPLSTAFTYQGVLKFNGDPVNDLCDFRFSLWDAPQNPSTQVGLTQVHNAIPVNQGYFLISQLDFGVNAFNGEQRWLQIAARCPTGSGSFTTLTPRQSLTAAPYALYASQAGTLPWSGLEDIPPGFADGVDNNTTYTPGPGLTLTNGQFSADFDGSGSASTISRSDHDHWGQIWFSNGADLGLTLSANTGSDNATGLYSIAHMPAGTGVQGVVAPPGISSGMGVPTAVSGISLAPAGGTTHQTFGVFGSAEGEGGFGVFGVGTYTGTAGIADGPEGMGIYGLASGTNAAGVLGRGNDEDGYGVIGVGLVGVHGVSEVDGGKGVIGEVLTGSNSYGVWGISNAGYAGYFTGDVNITGNLTKSGGAFKIDNPLDPANEYLYHSFVESPDMKDIYDGVITLDESGQATVTLPDWFEALNRDFRYQLTCLGGYAPVYIAQEIQKGAFVIAGGTPGLKVSWQVTGIRQDPWANDNRIPVEELKPPEEVGTYLYPQGYGQPETMGVDYARIQQIQEGPQTLPLKALVPASQTSLEKYGVWVKQSEENSPQP